MIRSIVALMLVFGLALMSSSSAIAQPFIPKKPEDLLPKKPEDVIPKIPKPNWPPQNEPGLSGSTKIHFNYTIRNTSSETVRFRLPSGRDYVLKPGQSGQYEFTGYKLQATLLVHNTGRAYDLRGGDHKFWLMQNRTVGFDMNYRTD